MYRNDWKMDLDVATRYLPPLVQGKIHGYLKMVISEVIWHRTRPGDVTVIATWWGETDSAHFRPVDPAMSSTRTTAETTEIYAIRTNLDLFEEYLTNCCTVDLLIISEPLNEVVGTARISDLPEIFRGKPYIEYCSITNKVGTKIGDIPVHLELCEAHRAPRKSKDTRSSLATPSSLLGLDLGVRELTISPKKPHTHNISPTIERDIFSPEDHVYRSILKEKRFSTNRTTEKLPSKVTDKLVAQVVAKAQKLRGILLKETREEDSPDTNENSLEGNHPENSPEDLYKYFMGSSMSQKEEKRALEKLRSSSPTPSLIDMATDTITSCRNDRPADRCWSRGTTEDLPDELNEEILSNRLRVQQKEATPMDYVDSLRIFIDSLSLTPAGYRRVKSSCLCRGDGVPISVTYFVQYDAAFGNVKKYNKKVINEGKKPVKISSRRQDGQTINFHHEAVYSLPRSHLHLQMNTPLRFKIFNRHLEQRTPTELGVGSMYIRDAVNSSHLSSTQKLAVVKKGIKIGELRVTIELGSDRIHFGKQFIDAVTMAKENIPVLELSQGNHHRCTTGEESKTSGTSAGIATIPDRRDFGRREGSGEASSAGRDMERADERLKTDVPVRPDEKTLLHGLIHIVEGRNIPTVSSYIVCRALWRQDKSSSRLCTGTTPQYNFHQIMPLIYGPELLERTKDNCIITEIYSKSPIGVDSLIGISKLSVHQLYVAFRDPLVLPNLLKSRFPVISVDDWVPITNPVTGRLCGELSALVALGTADQIALLEMTRDLRGRNTPDDDLREHLNLHGDTRELGVRSQECQTEISTVSDMKSSDSRFKIAEEFRGEQTAVLHTIVDKLAQALTAPRVITNQEAQTEFQVPTRESDHHMEMNPNAQIMSSNPSNSGSLSGDSFNESHRDNFEISREIYRSVGVGAEFNESPGGNNQTGRVDYPSAPGAVGKRIDVPSSSKNEAPGVKGLEDPDDDLEDEEVFRVIIEVECALHLPTVEVSNGPVEPSTYVTLQKALGREERTDVCPYSCNPRYDWRCDTKLSTEFLTNDKMRLIMKVWRLVDAEVDGRIDRERDIVIGFSAVDLSILTAGFPVVSGWFDINDFSGKTNGQLKVSVTPLENISSISRCGGTSRAPAPVDHSNFSSPYPEDLERMAGRNDIQTAPKTSAECSQIPTDCAFDIALGLGDASMSFLSSSLKQKLTELDEIKQRLQSRLLDVTSTAFEDDFDNDFDFIEGEGEPEGDDNNGNRLDIEDTSGEALVDTSSPANGLVNRITNGNGEVIGQIEVNKFQNISDNVTSSPEANLTDTGYSSGSNVHQTITNGHMADQWVLDDPENLDPVVNGLEDQGYPARGTRMHISHLLDKLSMQLTTAPAPIANLPMKRNIMDLISSLRRNNNNFSNDIKCNRQANVRTVPTQTDTNFHSNSQPNNLEVKTETKRNNSTSSGDEDRLKEDEIPAKTQKREKVSTIVREELINDEQNDSSEYDELSTHLITSNIRHMNSNGMVNPLLYRHALPDMDLPEMSEVQATGQTSSPSLTPDDDTLERLESRYSESFSATINKSLGRLRNFLDGESTSLGTRLSPVESTELFRVTPSGIPENTDGNIDVTVIHKPCNDELMASNSMGSVTTVSENNTLRSGSEIDDCSSVNTETSVSAASRQAPDGGNTVEDPGRPVLMKGKERPEDSSSGN
ncbi:C2 domain-containing protein 3 [Diachasmimorpha longicaudata]|uniref:C2 domain-containing protein 3 n=1 Tax=Diachasmimorpha longicaudata TaxID=58733 RepID=UPI0030B8895B